VHGRIAGVSGTLLRALDDDGGGASFRIPFLLGLIGTGLAVTITRRRRVRDRPRRLGHDLAVAHPRLPRLRGLDPRVRDGRRDRGVRARGAPRSQDGALAAPQAIDARLVAGSAIFGIGWGLSGYCPGPALVSVGASIASGIFVLAMVAGIAIARRV
jgi:uncharacterized membrane protein YedE/YeeE